MFSGGCCGQSRGLAPSLPPLPLVLPLSCLHHAGIPAGRSTATCSAMTQTTLSKSLPTHSKALYPGTLVAGLDNACWGKVASHGQG